ncbi:MAG: ABC transporter permease [Syntrophales bacterium]
MQLSWPKRSPVIQWSGALAAILMVAFPLVPLAYQSFLDRPIYESGSLFTLNNYLNLFTNPLFHQTVVNSFLFALMASSASVFLGAVAAIFVNRTDLPFDRLWRNIFLWPFFVSTIIMVFGYILMYGPKGMISNYMMQFFGFIPWNLYSIPGMAMVSAIHGAPVAFIFCSSSVVLADSSLEDAARAAGAGPYRAIGSVTLPLLRPSLLFAAVLSFTGALEAFSTPVLLGKPVGILMFTSFLYEQGIQAVRPDYGLVASGAMVVVALVTGMIVVQERLLTNVRRFVTIRGKATAPRKIRLGVMKPMVVGLVFLWLMLTIILPLGAVVLRSFVAVLSPYIPFWEMLTLDNYENIITNSTNYISIWNALYIAVIGGALSTTFLILIALIGRRSKFPGRTVLNFVAFFPRAVPSIIIGFGFFMGFIMFPFLGPIRSTIWGLILVYTVRHMPGGFGNISAPILRISEEMDNAVRVSGGDWWTAVRLAVIPLLKPAIMSTFLLLLVIFTKEYSAALFIMAPGSEVAGVVMLNHWFQGEAGTATAMSVVQLVLTALIVVFASRVLRVKIYG